MSNVSENESEYSNIRKRKLSEIVDLPFKIIGSENKSDNRSIRRRRISEVILQLPSNQIDHNVINDLAAQQVSYSDLHRGSDDQRDSFSFRELRRNPYYFKIKLHMCYLCSDQFEAIQKICATLDFDPDENEEDKSEIVRAMFLNFELKQKVKLKVKAADEERRKNKKLTILSHFKLKCRQVWKKCYIWINDRLHTFKFWENCIMGIHGRFGSGVASYFIFLRWLLHLNISSFIIIFFFVVIPQMIHESTKQPYEIKPNNTKNSLSSSKMTTNEGWRSLNSILYFGAYTTHTIKSVHGMHYSMPLAYLFTMGIYLCMNVLPIFYKFTTSYKTKYLTPEQVINTYSNKVFSTWNFTCDSEDAAELEAEKFSEEILALLDLNEEEHEAKLQEFNLNLFLNILFETSLIGAAYITYLLWSKLKADGWYMGAAVAAMCRMFYLFSIYFAEKEVYSSHQTRFYESIARNVLFKTVYLSFIYAFWMTSCKKENAIEKCCASDLGGSIIHIFTINFFASILLLTVIGEFLRQLINVHIINLNRPVFDVRYNVLELIYYQTLVWFSCFFVPLAPLFMVMILIPMFYIKYYTVIFNCEPPRKSWNVDEAHVVFFLMLIIGLLLSVLSVVNILFQVEPISCGPFKNHQNMNYAVFYYLLGAEEHLVNTVAPIIQTVWFQTLIFFILLGILSRQRGFAIGYVGLMESYQKNIGLERQDKAFLLKAYEDILKET